jgi:hypothetical protein
MLMYTGKKKILTSYMYSWLEQESNSDIAEVIVFMFFHPFHVNDGEQV